VDVQRTVVKGLESGTAKTVQAAMKQVTTSANGDKAGPRPPYDPEADADQFLRLRDRLCGRWTTPQAIAVLRRTFKQLLNELPGGPDGQWR
jgi:hypothetical protein